MALFELLIVQARDEIPAGHSFDKSRIAARPIELRQLNQSNFQSERPHFKSESGQPKLPRTVVSDPACKNASLSWTRSVGAGHRPFLKHQEVQMSGIKGYSVMTSRTFMAVALATSIAILAITSVSTPSLAGETHYRHHQKHRVSVGLGY